MAARRPRTRRARWLPSDDPRAGDLLAAVVDNARGAAGRGASPPATSTTVGAVDPDGRWQAAVDMTWRFDGFDDGPGARGGAGRLRRSRPERATVGITGVRRRRPALAALAQRPAGGPPIRRLAGAGRRTGGRGGPGRRPCRRRGPGRAARCCRSGRDGWWSRCRRSEAAPGRRAGAPSRAPTPTSRRSRRRWTAPLTPDSQVHVFVNPDVYDDLEPVGGQVVISHEATHVATGAPLTTGVPLWLLEGFADYVALRDVDLPITTTAGQIIAAGPRATAPPDAPARARPSSTRPTRTSARRTRAPGSPAWCSPTRAARTRWCALYEPVVARPGPRRAARRTCSASPRPS